MNLPKTARRVLLGCGLVAMMLASAPAFAQAQATRTTRIVGTVRDESNAIPLPGLPVEVVGTSQTVYTDVDGRYVLEVPAGKYEIRVSMDGYEPRTISVDAANERSITADIGLSMSRFAETVTVTADVVTAETSSAAAQLIERKNAQVITDNLGSDEMKANGDSDAAVAMSRVTGLSVVDNQYVFVRGLGERYSNTTLAGSVLPTTEPDKKVVPLDMFPAGLIDSVQVAKSYSADKSAEFAGGLVQIVPLKFPSRPVVDLSFGMNFYTTATGKDVPFSSINGQDGLGYDDGARAMPSTFPSNKIVRQGIYTPDVGYNPVQITEYGRQLGNVWTPTLAEGAPGPSWGAVLGNRTGKFGYIASISQSYREQYVEEQRAFYRVAGEDPTTGENRLEAVSDYAMQYGTQKAQLGFVGNIGYQFTSNHRLSFENFYSHSGRDEGRYFEGPNTENNFYFKNYRLQFIEEGLLSNAVGGEHFFQQWSNSRFDWRVNYAQARRDEPDLRETLYQGSITATPETRTFLLADESQSGFRMFNELEDDTWDAGLNWSLLTTSAGRATQYKFGFNVVGRTRAFESRRFRFIPSTANKDGAVPVNLALPPEELYAPNNIGTAFRFNEETRPVDAYDGDQTTTAGYGQVDFALTAATRLVAGARVERFDQVVTTFDPFGLFTRTVTAENINTDIFPAVNLVHSMRPDMNLRMSYSTTVNRPEFRELAEFEFTDVVGSRAIRGNPDLNRALIQNVDGRWETFLGARGLVAGSAFYKYFDQPIERVVLAAANPIVTFQNAEKARNFGVELEAGYPFTDQIFLSGNYTFVDSQVTLAPEQRAVQTSQERALAGQSKNLFNVTAEYAIGGFASRLLYNFTGDRISDVGANDAPDIVEEGRGSLDLVFSQRFGDFGVRLNLENLTDEEYRYTQGTEDQRLYNLGRTIGVSFSYSWF